MSDTVSEDNSNSSNSISISIPTSTSLTPPSYTSWNYASTGTGGYVYSGMGSTGSIGIATSGVNFSDFNNSIVVHTRDGRRIDVVDTIEKISNIIGLIIPQKHLIEKYPALKTAYDEYEKQLRMAFIDSNPALKDAMESYKTMETILKNSDDDE